MLPVLFLIIFVNVTKAYFGVHILVVICVSLIHSMSYMCKHGSSKREGERVFHVCARLYVFVFLNSAGSKKPAENVKLVTIVIAASEWIKRVLCILS